MRLLEKFLRPLSGTPVPVSIPVLIPFPALIPLPLPVTDRRPPTSRLARSLRSGPLCSPPAPVPLRPRSPAAPAPSGTPTHPLTSIHLKWEAPLTSSTAPEVHTASGEAR
ncbi:hypothetical protein GCM10023224_21780 [Streptomonospora halophila]|uniref:Uncharacterized protein n=1 Tax=Streptomonospora halophila TaxID=427369 RepID=A0ABP9GE37_9ACTN